MFPFSKISTSGGAGLFVHLIDQLGHQPLLSLALTNDVNRLLLRDVRPPPLEPPNVIYTLVAHIP
jgi:hypothetical protein